MCGNVQQKNLLEYNSEWVLISESMSQPTILILCTGNSCRSQMAEYFLRSAVGDAAVVVSAGCDPAGYVHPVAIQVMQEKGYDLSAAESQPQTDFIEQDVAVVVTVCSNADQECPTFPGQKKHYCWKFDDPAHAEGSDEEKLAVFRRVRDEIERVFTAYGYGWVDASAR